MALANGTQRPFLNWSKLEAGVSRTGRDAKIRRNGTFPSLFLLLFFFFRKWAHCSKMIS